MKNHLLFILLLISLTSYGQTSYYHAFPDSNASWCVEGYSGGFDPDCDFFSAYYQLTGDVQLNGHVYHKLSFYEVNERWQCSMGQLVALQNYFIDTATYYIRQDTSQRKVWIFDLLTMKDTILYDFNLQIGDTLSTSNVYWGSACFECVVTSIDSIFLNGNYRKKINFHSNCNGFGVNDTSIVEGVGGMHGLLSIPSCFEFTNSLREFNQDNILVYSSPWLSWHFSNCQTLINIDKLEPKVSCSIFPNPFYDRANLNIITSKSISYILNIYNSTGRLVRIERINRPTTIIERNNLTTGIYTFRVVDVEGKSMSGKFIIE